MGGWDNVGETKKETNNDTATTTKKVKAVSLMSDAELENYILNSDTIGSPICVGYYGLEGTGKTGSAMSCRSEQEIKDGYKIIDIDFDGGGIPVKMAFHDNDPNIIVKNPLVNEHGSLFNLEDSSASIDYDATFSRLKQLVNYIQKNHQQLKLKAIIFDGLDKFLKICEYSMRKDLEKEVSEGIMFNYWKDRNKKYLDIVEAIKYLPVDKYFITHIRKETDQKGNPTGDYKIDWQKATADMMIQNVRFSKIKKESSTETIVTLKATVEKCNNNLMLEGKDFIIAQVKHNKEGTIADWFGFRWQNNKIIQDGKK